MVAWAWALYHDSLPFLSSPLFALASDLSSPLLALASDFSSGFFPFSFSDFSWLSGLLGQPVRRQCKYRRRAWGNVRGPGRLPFEFAESSFAFFASSVGASSS